MVTRLAATLGALGIATGAIIFWRSVVASQGWSNAGYISEAGVSGSPHAFGYRFGIVLIAGGLLLLALALRHTLPLAAACLALGGLFSSMASAVNCSAGCPLPPYEVPTFTDLVHAGASIAAVSACLGAMAVVAVRAPTGAVRTLSRAWLVVAMPLFLVAATSLLLVGRGRLTGDTERLILAVVIAWAFVLAVLYARTPKPAMSTDDSASSP